MYLDFQTFYEIVDSMKDFPFNFSFFQSLFIFLMFNINSVFLIFLSITLTAIPSHFMIKIKHIVPSTNRHFLTGNTEFIFYVHMLGSPCNSFVFIAKVNNSSHITQIIHLYEKNLTYCVEYNSLGSMYSLWKLNDYYSKRGGGNN